MTEVSNFTKSAPNGSILTYGFVGLSLGGGVILALAGFYGIGLSGHGPLIPALLGLAFAGGVILHVKRTILHRQAAP